MGKGKADARRRGRAEFSQDAASNRQRRISTAGTAVAAGYINDLVRVSNGVDAVNASCNAVSTGVADHHAVRHKSPQMHNQNVVSLKELSLEGSRFCGGVRDVRNVFIYIFAPSTADKMDFREKRKSCKFSSIPIATIRLQDAISMTKFKRALGRSAAGSADIGPSAEACERSDSRCFCLFQERPCSGAVERMKVTSVSRFPECTAADGDALARSPALPSPSPGRHRKRRPRRRRRRCGESPA
jgi:hypothetical protein